MAKTEVDGDGREANLPGVYVHKESGAELEAVTAIQADAFVRLGYKPKVATDEESEEPKKGK